MTEAGDDEIWAHEERFWTDGEDFYRDALDPAALMAFRAPVGLLAGDEIVRRVNAAPRWRQVEMRKRKLQRPSEDLMVLGYVAEGRREDLISEEIVCSSTYRRDGGSWLLVQHQQTPAHG